MKPHRNRLKNPADGSTRPSSQVHKAKNKYDRKNQATIEFTIICPKCSSDHIINVCIVESDDPLMCLKCGYIWTP